MCAQCVRYSFLHDGASWVWLLLRVSMPGGRQGSCRYRGPCRANYPGRYGLEGSPFARTYRQIGVIEREGRSLLLSEGLPGVLHVSRSVARKWPNPFLTCALMSSFPVGLSRHVVGPCSLIGLVSFYRHQVPPAVEQADDKLKEKDAKPAKAVHGLVWASSCACSCFLFFR